MTDKRIPGPDEPRLYRASPRGIGQNWIACMVCGGSEERLRHDCAFFVPSRETGEAIVALFKTGARLDYRPHEPSWIQVKIGACDLHRARLVELVRAADETKERLDGPGISEEMVRKFTGDADPAPASASGTLAR